EILTRFVVINEYLSGISLLRHDNVAFTNSANFNSEYVYDYIMSLLNQKGPNQWKNRRFTNVHTIYANNAKKSMDVITYIVRYKNIMYPDETNYLLLDIPIDS